MDKKRERLSEYLNMDIREEEFYHVYSKMMEIEKNIIPNEDQFNYAYLEHLDNTLKENPAVISGKRYHSLKTLVEYYLREYNVMFDIKGREDDQNIPQTEEEMDILMATEYGI